MNSIPRMAPVLRIAQRALTSAGFALGLLAVATASASSSKPLGTILGWGNYAVEGVPASAGTLIFAGDVVTTGAEGGAEVTLVSGSFARIEATSEVVVSGVADFELRRGAFTLRSGLGEPARARVLGRPIVIGTRQPALCRLETAAGSGLVTAESGLVTIEGGSSPVLLPPGRSFRLPAALERTAGPTAMPSEQYPPVPPALAAPSTAQAAPAAGRVFESYPDEVVRHPGSPIAVPLRLGEIVEVGDALGTVGEGRVRLELLDGTFVDLGAATSIQIVQHNPEAHLTELDLHAGHLRADVGARQGPEARFEVRTAAAQVTASSTMLFVAAEAKQTAVCNAGSGPVTVRSARSLPGAVSVATGECSITRPGSPPDAPRPDMARLEREMKLASFEAAPNPFAPVAARKKGAVSANATAAILAFVNFLELHDAADATGSAANALQSAETGLQSAASTLSAAAANAGTAGTVAQTLCLALLQYEEEMGRVLSPSAPAEECGE
jgi:hypothetical protein